jgi:hypothetical protein
MTSSMAWKACGFTRPVSPETQYTSLLRGLVFDAKWRVTYFSFLRGQNPLREGHWWKRDPGETGNQTNRIKATKTTLLDVPVFVMISYQLAKELKAAGFPQGELARAQQQAGYDYVSMPTLTTLIEACGEDFGALGREANCWIACECVPEHGVCENVHEGESPEDAVARLWLSLNQRAAAESKGTSKRQTPAGDESNRPEPNRRGQ